MVGRFNWGYALFLTASVVICFDDEIIKKYFKKAWLVFFYNKRLLIFFVQKEGGKKLSIPTDRMTVRPHKLTIIG
jgi:hypothetical protein